MLRYSRTSEVSTSARPHHERCTSEPSTLTSSASVQTTKSLRQAKVASLAARQKSAAAAAAQTTRLSGRYQKKRSSTLDRSTTTTTSKPSAASKSSQSSSLLAQIGDWARRSFRGGRGPDGRRPKSLHNDYVVREANSGIVVERKSAADRLPVGGSRDHSPVTTSSGYASGGDCVYSRLHEVDLEVGDERRQRQGHEQVGERQTLRGVFRREGNSRGSRRYRRRASVGELNHTAPVKPEVVSPSATADEINGLPVYENLLSKVRGLPTQRWGDSQLRPDVTERLNNSRPNGRHKPEVSAQRISRMSEETEDTGNASIDDYLVAVEHSLLNDSTVRRTGNRYRRDASPLYVNGNLLMTSLNQSARCQVDRCRSRSLSSSRDRTLTEQSTTMACAPQRLNFTASFVDPPAEAGSPDRGGPDAAWDDRLSTLSIGCRRAPRGSPGRRPQRQDAAAASPSRRRSKSARRRLPFDVAVTSLNRRPEAVDESVRPLFARTVPTAAISNVAACTSPSSRRRSTRLFPGLTDHEEESVYDTISDVIGRPDCPESDVMGKSWHATNNVIATCGHPSNDVSRRSANDVIGRSGHRASRAVAEVELDGYHVYDNIDDVTTSSFCAPPTSAIDIHQLPPPLPPPPVPARRTATLPVRELPLCRSDVIDLDSHHVYTIADVLDSFDALAEHLPRAQRFIYDLQATAYLQRRHQLQETGRDDRRDRVSDAEGRWLAAAASKSRGCSSGTEQQQRSHGDTKSSTWYGGPTHRRPRHHAASTEYQPIIVEDYVCSPGNRHSGERPRRPGGRTTTPRPSAASTNHPHDGLYLPMKPGNKAGSGIFCCGGRAATSLDTRNNTLPPRSPHAVQAEAFKRPKLPTRKFGKETSRLSRSITQLAPSEDVDRRRRSSNTTQTEAAAGNSSMMTSADRPPGEVSRLSRALSRSLMDGFSCQAPPRRTGAPDPPDRKQNVRVTSPAVGVDLLSARSYTVLDQSSSSGDLAAQYGRGSATRSASEDRRTGTGNSSRSKSPTPVEKHRQTGKSSHRGRPTQPTTSGLSRSRVDPPREQFSVSGTASFHEHLPRQSDNRRSSILQWNATSCSRREIFC